MIKNPIKAKSSRTKIFTAVTVLVIVLMLVLNLLVFASGIYDTVYLDLTPEELYTTRDVMFDACERVFYTEDGKLREPGIKITFCSDPDTLIGNYTTRPIYHMAIDLAKRFDNLTVETVNINYNPTAIADYKTTSLTTIETTDVIISYGQRYRITSADSFWRIADDSYYSFDGEYKLATILMSLTLINQPVAYFVTDHGEDYYDFDNPESEMSKAQGYLIDLLRERGFSVKNISLGKIISDADAATAAGNKVAPQLPEDCALLVINNPKTDFVYDESRADSYNYISETELIDRFLTKGNGAVMVAKDYRLQLPVFEEFLAEWGIKCTDTLVKDSGSFIENDLEPYTTLVAEYNSNEDSYAYEIYGEYANLSSAPRTVISDTGHILCSFEDSTSVGEAGSLNTSRIFAPFLYTSDKAADYAYNSLTGSYVDKASDEGIKTLAAICGRQTINNDTAETEHSYLFCAASADFFSAELLGNSSYANYDIVSALVQSISRLDTYASMELGGISGNNYQGFGGKVLTETSIGETDTEVYEYDENGKAYMTKVNYGLTNTMKVVYAVIIAVIPLAVAVVGIVVRIKRRYL